MTAKPPTTAVVWPRRAEASKAKLSLNGSGLRFGLAAVERDYDSGTARLFINKEVPGSFPPTDSFP